MAENIPQVFISYSHDTPEHKQWVATFASQLMKNGVQVLLDQWELRYGDDVPKFMEKGVREADRVLMICTEPYVNKANEGQGGVGYEAMIVTGELVRDLGTSKFIPIIRQDTKPPILPTSVSTRLYINMSSESAYNDEFEKLLHELHDAPAIKKPPLGKKPSKFFDTDNNPSSAEDSKPHSSLGEYSASETGLPPATYYDDALNILRAEDITQWRKLVYKAKTEISSSIIEWRSKHEAAFPQEWKDILPIAISGAATYAPLISIALAGVESGQPKFNNQRAILDDILYPRNWSRAGITILADFPITLAFIYQGLHGATCLATNQLDMAIKLITSSVEFPGLHESIPFWQNPGAMGWPGALAGNCTTGWNSLSKLAEEWPWLNSIFGDSTEFKAALCAYYMALNVYEFVQSLENGLLNDNTVSNGIHLEIPICFVSEPNEIKRRGYSLFSADLKTVTQIWRSRGITDEVARANWKTWMSICKSWSNKVYSFSNYNITHEKLMEEVFPASSP